MKEREPHKIYIIEDDELLSLVLLEAFKSDGFRVTADSGLEGVIGRVREENPDLILLDITLPYKSGLDMLKELRREGLQCPVIILTADDSAATAVNALKLGAYDYLTKPFEMEKVKLVAGNALEARRLKETVKQCRDESFDATIIGKDPQVIRLIQEIERMAKQRVSGILVTGESGTGKELVARALHNASPAFLGPFIAVNCAALPQGLLESELFGYEKGAFTDAKEPKKGLFELADGGTLVLDEVGDMDLQLQAKLLRVLETRAVRKIGSSREIPFDVMVVATTNRDLARMQGEGTFRKDLFYRLNTFNLKIPPLRERKDDIPLLAEHFLAHFKKEFGKPSMQLSKDAMDVLKSYNWPGNVRELKSLFAKTMLLEDTDIITPEHILMRLDVTSSDEQVTSFFDNKLSLADIEKNILQQTMLKAKGNMTKAARLLNVSYDTLRYRLKKFGIK